MCDIAFVIDATGSMAEEIDGIRNSVISFASFLKSSGVDLRIAGAAFGDEVRDVHPFTTDVASFQAWVSKLDSTGGGDFAENPLDAVAVLETGQTWRDGAQHVMVVVTDAPIHEGDEVTTRTIESVRDSIVGRIVVHAISPGSARGVSRYSTNDHSDVGRGRSESRDIQVLGQMTGGVWVQMPYNGNVDLTALPIKDVLLSGYEVRYRSTIANPARDRDIRLIVSVDGLVAADQKFVGHY